MPRRTPLQQFLDQLRQTAKRATQPVKKFSLQAAALVFDHYGKTTLMAISAAATALLLIHSIAHRPPFEFPWYVPLGFLLGLLWFTLAEYLAHRWLIHRTVKYLRINKIRSWLRKWLNSTYPAARELLMAGLLAWLVWRGWFWFFGLVLNIPWWVNPLLAGSFTGWLLNLTMRWLSASPWTKLPLVRRLTGHRQLHAITGTGNFGISSPLWDRVFGTYLGD